MAATSLGFGLRNQGSSQTGEGGRVTVHVGAPLPWGLGVFPAGCRRVPPRFRGAGFPLPRRWRLARQRRTIDSADTNILIKLIVKIEHRIQTPN